MTAEPVKDLLIPEPAGNVLMHFERGRFKDQDVAPVLDSGHVVVERFQALQMMATRLVVVNCRGTAFRSRRQPSSARRRFSPDRSTQAFQEAHAGGDGVQAVHVIDDDGMARCCQSWTYMPKGVALPSIQQASGPTASCRW